jgi:hypothetical protein
MGQTVSSAKSSASKLWCFINPRFASSESFTPFYGNYEKLKSQEDCFNLQIHPHELQFPCNKSLLFYFYGLLFSLWFTIFVLTLSFCETVELKKEISCSLQLSNNSDNYLAFKVIIWELLYYIDKLKSFCIFSLNQ